MFSSVHTRVAALAATVLAAGATDVARAGSEICDEHQLVPSDRPPFARFGQAVALSGGTALIGAGHDDTNGNDAGAAYVFVRAADGRWSQAAKLLAPDGDAGDRFGFAVALDGDVAIVGAFADRDEAGEIIGSAYVFRRDAEAWGEAQKLVPDGAVESGFGFAVAVAGDVAVVGARYDDHQGPSSGAAYVYRRTRGRGEAWSLEQKLLASDGTAGDNFGASVSIDRTGRTIAVGAPLRLHYQGYYTWGSVYVFRLEANAWDETQQLDAWDAPPELVFGRVALRGGLMIVGAAGAGLSPPPGAAYVFRDLDGTWSPEPKLDPPDDDPEDQFGSAVAIEDDLALVGAGEDDGGGIQVGSVYVYRADGVAWTAAGELAPPVAADNLGFGHALAIESGVVLAGAPGPGFPRLEAGTAFVFRPCACAEDVDGDGMVGTDDLIAVVLAWGQASPAADVNDDGVVDVDDLVAVILAWGPCWRRSRTRRSPPGRRGGRNGPGRSRRRARAARRASASSRAGCRRARIMSLCRPADPSRCPF